MSLSNNKIKYIQSLKDKKFRNKYNTFVAEGEKLVVDLLATCKCQLITGLPEVLGSIPELRAEEVIEAHENELKKATSLKTAPTVIAVFYRPEFNLKREDINNKLNLVLDGVQDPGNLGTIVRIADWFGIDYIFCSEDCSDIFNPKTVQATMGAIARVQVVYTNVVNLLKGHAGSAIYGTFLYGDNIYETELGSEGFIVMGSEGRGVSIEVKALITNKLYIPNYPVGEKSSESLNVAVATAITCSEFRRRVF